MIDISIRYSGRCYSVAISGHAEYGEPGKDIVCAGVSAITYTMANYLLSSRNVCHQQVEDDGNFYMSCILGNKSGDGADKAREALEAIGQGYLLLSEEYPGYVKTEIAAD